MASEVIGAPELIAALRAWETRVQEASKRIVTRGQAVIESEVKGQFRGAHRKGTPTPSAPGQPPAVITGTLRRSVKSTTPMHVGESWEGRVFPSAVYARIQELGGTAGHGSVLPRRPYVAPGLLLARPRIATIATQEWKKVLP